MPRNPANVFSDQYKSTFRINSEFVTFFDTRNIKKANMCSSIINSLIFVTVFGSKLFLFYKIKSMLVLFQMIEFEKEIIVDFSVSNKNNHLIFFTKKNNVVLYMNEGEKNIQNKSILHRNKLKKKNIFLETRSFTENIIWVGFDFSEKFVILSFENGKIQIRDLSGKIQFAFQLNSKLQPDKIFLKNARSGTVCGINGDQNFVLYDLSTEKYNIIGKTDLIYPFDNFFLCKIATQKTFNCVCHKKKLNSLNESLADEIFFPISDERMLVSHDKKFKLIGIHRNLSKKCCFYTSLIGKEIFEKKNQLILQKFLYSGCIFFFFLQLRPNSLQYFKPIHEKYGTFINFDYQYGKISAIYDVKFIGKKNYFIVASYSDGIAIKTIRNFSHKAKFIYKKSCFINLKVLGAIFMGLEVEGSIIFWNLLNHQILLCFQSNYQITNVFSFLKIHRSHGRLFTGNKNGSIRVWDILFEKKRKTKMSLLISQNINRININSLIVSPNGKIIAISLVNKKVFLWKMYEKTFYLSLSNFKRCIWCMDFSPVRETIVSGCGDGNVMTFNFVSGKLLKKIEGTSNPIISCKFSLDGFLIFGSTSDGQIKIWRDDVMICVNTLSNHQNAVWNFDISLDSGYIISGCTGGKIVISEDYGRYVSQQKNRNLKAFVKFQKIFLLIA